VVEERDGKFAVSSSGIDNRFRVRFGWKRQQAGSCAGSAPPDAE
jgi:hypothetical protein